METENALYVGIDLGTTNSAIAVFDGSEVQVVRNGQGSLLTPSVVRIDARGRVTVGSRARVQFETDSENVRGEFKRLMGSTSTLDFPGAKTSRSPQELSAAVLSSLRRDVGDFTGVQPTRAVISVPALFELPQTAATAEAARLAGFETIELIQEPVASAIAAGWKQTDSHGPWLVYDLGGGTLDVSLLETSHGMLRAIGHDGDNFLGGRDFDRMILDIVLTKLAANGIDIQPANPAHQTALRRLRVLAEDAKVELTRSYEAPISLSGLALDGAKMDIDVVVTRAEFEAHAGPLIDRTIAVTDRLLALHGVPGDSLQRLVLVGGPTVMPLLRQRVMDHYRVSIAPSLDPMTLVAQGAALFAGTIGLSGRPTKPAGGALGLSGPRVWLHFPAMTPDLTPYVVGKILDLSSAVSTVDLQREDATWQSPPISVEPDGSFAAMVELSPGKMCTFTLSGRQANQAQVVLTPGKFSITHGCTLGEPPLARTVGVALADNSVRVFFERGSLLPIRRTFSFTTSVSVPKSVEGFALRVPIVQGEFRSASFCRLVGSLEIPSAGLAGSLAQGSEIEVTLELDKGGGLRAEARVVATGQVFNQVALLLTQAVSLESLEQAIAGLQVRLDQVSRQAFKSRSVGDAGGASEWLGELAEIRRNEQAFRGGDLDAGEQARRAITDLDRAMSELESDKVWPALLQRASKQYAGSLGLVAKYGSSTERQALDWAYAACKAAIEAKEAESAERNLQLMHDLGSAAFFRAPDVWEQLFEQEVGLISTSRDLKRATELVEQGRAARRENRQSDLEPIVRQLSKLRVVADGVQLVGHGSGLLTP